MPAPAKQVLAARIEDSYKAGDGPDFSSEPLASAATDTGDQLPKEYETYF